MATRHGNVCRGQHSRKQYSDLDAAAARTVDAAGRRLGLQHDMRHPHSERTVHEMESMGHTARYWRRRVDRHIRRHSLAGA